ncbi:MAG: hypothetical protein L6R41_005709 [Letrouitia leprolyta]|nr:MAG: hypothetical protein L6R41_005709 [Letrouitia leprolyta]
MAKELQIYTRIHSRYRVFDTSGQLPFSIVFGFCRRSSADIDPRPVLIETAGSVLDVPYALTHGLLALYEEDRSTLEWIEIDLGLHEFATKAAGDCISLPSPVDRIEGWRDAFAVYQYRIDVDGDLQSILLPGKKYRIRLASQDLGVKRWAYSNRTHFIDNEETPSNNSEPVRLVNSKSTAGNATFKTVTKLKWPPIIKTRMRLCALPQPSEEAAIETEKRSGDVLEVSVLNTSLFPVSVQTRGHQYFLHPWGIFEPEPDVEDDRPRIIDADPIHPPTSSLQIIDSATGDAVREKKQQRAICHLTSLTAERRAMLDHVVTLKPGEPLIKIFNVKPFVEGLADGQYKIQMQSKGCRWWDGEIKKEESEDGRVHEHYGGVLIPPLMLETQDEVEIEIRDGIIYSSL